MTLLTGFFLLSLGLLALVTYLIFSRLNAAEDEAYARLVNLWLLDQVQDPRPSEQADTDAPRNFLPVGTGREATAEPDTEPDRTDQAAEHPYCA